MGICIYYSFIYHTMINLKHKSRPQLMLLVESMWLIQTAETNIGMVKVSPLFCVSWLSLSPRCVFLDGQADR